jgi:signal peptidase II
VLRSAKSRVTTAGIVAVAVVALDQITKTLVLESLDPGERFDLGAVHIIEAYNTGMAFSLGDGWGGLAVVVAVLVGVLVWAAKRELTRKERDGESSAASTFGATRLSVLGFGALLGGAFGNLIDRVFRAPGFGKGAVVDFIDVKGFLDFWPVFNVADAALTVGAIALVFASFQPPRHRLDASTTSSSNAT